MMKENSMLRQQATDALTGNWGSAAIITLIYMAIAVGASQLAGGVLSLATLPLEYGLVLIFLKVVRGEKIETSQLFEGYKDIGRVFGTVLLMRVYVLLWTLLLIVPGIIKSYSYAMTYYVMQDHPELAYNAAIEKSMKMMEGYKMKLFLLDLSFIGWGILCCLTLGLGFLLLLPYVYTARAAFYEDLKKELGMEEATIEVM